MLLSFSVVCSSLTLKAWCLTSKRNFSSNHDISTTGGWGMLYPCTRPKNIGERKSNVLQLNHFCVHCMFSPESWWCRWKDLLRLHSKLIAELKIVSYIYQEPLFFLMLAEILSKLSLLKGKSMKFMLWST